MTFLLGIQAMLGQEPPIYFRSITTARIPFLAKVQAKYLPASPQPSTTRSYSSECDMGGAFVELVSFIRKASAADRKWNERPSTGRSLAIAARLLCLRAWAARRR